jgi:hypothetical protein
MSFFQNGRESIDSLSRPILREGAFIEVNFSTGALIPPKHGPKEEIIAVQWEEEESDCGMAFSDDDRMEFDFD